MDFLKILLLFWVISSLIISAEALYGWGVTTSGIDLTLMRIQPGALSTPLIVLDAFPQFECWNIVAASNNTLFGLSMLQPDGNHVFPNIWQFQLGSEGTTASVVNHWNMSTGSARDIAYDNWVTKGWVYIVSRLSTSPQNTIQLIGLNPITNKTVVVKERKVDAEISSCYGGHGLVIDPKGNAYSFDYDGNGTVIWTVELVTGNATLLSLQPVVYASGWQYSSALNGLVAIGGVNVNYGQLYVWLYLPSAQQLIQHCKLPTTTPCLLASWLSGDGTQIQMMDCYTTVIVTFNLQTCMMVSSLSITAQTGYDLTNTRMTAVPQQ